MKKFFLTVLLFLAFIPLSQAQQPTENCNCLIEVKEQLAQIAKQYVIDNFRRDPDTFGDIAFINFTQNGDWFIGILGKAEANGNKKGSDFSVTINEQGEVTSYFFGH